MKRMLILGLSALAVLAMGVTASVASASITKPVFMECVKKTGGNYTSKECTPASKVAGTGKYELQAVKIGTELKGKSKVATLLVYIPTSNAEYWKGGSVAGKVSCKTDKSVSKITSKNTAEGSTEFKTCASEGKKCHSAGEKAGTIKTEVLVTTLVELSDGSSGTLVTPKTRPYFAKFECEGLSSEVTAAGPSQGQAAEGGLLGKNEGNTEKAVKKSKLVFKANETTGAQEYNHVFGGTEGEDVLFSLVTPPGANLPAGQIDTVENTGKTQVGVFEE